MFEDWYEFLDAWIDYWETNVDPRTYPGGDPEHGLELCLDPMLEEGLSRQECKDEIAEVLVTIFDYLDAMQVEQLMRYARFYINSKDYWMVELPYTSEKNLSKLGLLDY